MAQGRFADAEAEFRRAATKEPGDAETQRLWGYHELRRGNVKEADIHLRRAASIEPNSAQILISLAMVRADLGERAEAMKLLDRAFALNPLNPEAFRVRATMLAGEGKTKAGVAAFEKAFILGLDPSEFSEDWGQVLRKDHQYARALEVYRKAAEREPRNPRILTGWAATLLEKGEVMGAAEKVAQARRLRPYPNQDAPLLDAGTELFNQNRLSGAAAAFRDTITTNPKSWKAHLWLGQTLVKEGLVEDAIQQLQIAKELNASQDTIWLALGYAFALRNEHEKAIVHYQKALELNPKQEDAYFGIAESERALGRTDLALQTIMKGAEINPTDSHYPLYVAQAKEELGDLMAAADKYEQAYRLDAKNVEILTRWAGILLQKGTEQDLDQALELFRKALRLNPRELNSLRNTAAIFWRKEQYSEALKYYEKAANIRSPDRWKDYGAWGETLYTLGRFRAAVPVLRRAVKLNPDSAELRDTLAKCLEASNEAAKANEIRRK
jgi:superkiller protein 3